MFQFIQYIKFLLKSTNQHGVHSPFVYDLVTQCFYDKTEYPEYAKLKNYRNSLLKNKKNIKITDFGSGSKVFKSNERQISAIAKNSGTSLKRAQLLYRLVKYLNPKHTLELGTSLGIATQAMALAKTDNHIISLEGCPNISKFARKQISEATIKNITIKTGAFKTTLPNLKDQTYDLIFFDGNHNKTATLNYFETLINQSHNDSVFIFDDIYWSKDMMKAWEIIKTHPKVTVTIDTFFWGLVCFRTEQVKENFTIRV
ncbi:O-methyltransferase [Psychroserpens damuponensis]|uniref:O-methyltransferase n=1 Tax=Psychroserpens damuponensis TaxID=943936 RepID=UPI00058E2D94|nr:class I SAM-dependent methyltransferase [Psychroserpens damuponensis]